MCIYIYILIYICIFKYLKNHPVAREWGRAIQTIFSETAALSPDESSWEGRGGVA
jgi:hypothetical protein